MTRRSAELCCTCGRGLIACAVVIGAIPAMVVAAAFALAVIGVELLKHGEREWNRVNRLPPAEHDTEGWRT